MIPYEAIAIYILRDGVLVPQFVYGEDFRLFSSLEIPLGQGLSGWVAENRKPIINGNPSVEPGYLNDPGKFSHLRSALAVPLDGVTGPMGVLTLYRAGKDAFTRDNLRILLAVSTKISLSMENALKFRQAEDSATTDYLTKLPNARSLFLRLDAEVARCEREDSTLTVMVCDLDGFKAINDQYGHLQGNRVLQDVAEALRKNCREYDYVARMGGDEFVLLLPGSSQPEIAFRSEELRQIVADAASRWDFPGSVSMSIGAAVYPRDARNPNQLLAEADRRMYETKQQHKMLRQAFLNAALEQCAGTATLQ
jgi:diguanylate cyclase (GGDEF)-like protein